MAAFEPIVSKTFKFEGGYQAFPNDSANYCLNKQLVGTNHGISAIAYESYLGRCPSVADMKAITTDIAKKVYKKNYWDKMQLDEIADQSLAHIMFDAFIASGFEGMKRVKKAVNKHSPVFAAIDSTPFAKAQAEMINKIPSYKLFNSIKEGEIANRKALYAANPQKYGDFINGWLSRLNQINYDGVKFVGRHKTAFAVGGTVLLLTAITLFIYRDEVSDWLNKKAA